MNVFLDLDAVGSAGAHAERRIATPVVEHAELRAWHYEDQDTGLVVFAQHDVADEVGRIGDAGAVIPDAVDDVTALRTLTRAGDGADPVRRDEIAGRSEKLVLRAFGPVRGDQ